MEPNDINPCRYSPEHAVWEIEWLEPTATDSHKARTFRSYQKAIAEFDRLKAIPGLNPQMLGFNH